MVGNVINFHPYVRNRILKVGEVEIDLVRFCEASYCLKIIHINNVAISSVKCQVGLCLYHVIE